MAKKRDQLTDKDLDTLSRAADLRRRFNAGIFPTTGGDRSHFERLVRLGVLRCDDWGRDLDGEVERDVMVYQLTPAGDAALGHAIPGAI